MPRRLAALALTAALAVARPAAADLALGFHYPANEAACRGCCSDSAAVCDTLHRPLNQGGDTLINCVARAKLPSDRDDLWTLRLWGNKRYSFRTELVRERRIAPGMAGQADTVGVPTAYTLEATVWLTLSDSTGNESCASNYIELYQGGPDGRVDVGDLGPRLRFAIGPIPAGDRLEARVRAIAAAGEAPVVLSIEIADLGGRRYFEYSGAPPEGPGLVIETARWPAGLYFVRASAAGARWYRKLVVLH